MTMAPPSKAQASEPVPVPPPPAVAPIAPPDPLAAIMGPVLSAMEPMMNAMDKQTKELLAQQTATRTAAEAALAEVRALREQLDALAQALAGVGEE